MAYQFVREPLRTEEADQLCQACGTMLEKLIIWILIDTGLRVSELCSLTPQDILWQQRSLRISGKGGPYGKKYREQGLVGLALQYQSKHGRLAIIHSVVQQRECAIGHIVVCMPYCLLFLEEPSRQEHYR